MLYAVFKRKGQESLEAMSFEAEMKPEQLADTLRMIFNRRVSFFALQADSAEQAIGEAQKAKAEFRYLAPAQR